MMPAIPLPRSQNHRQFFSTTASSQRQQNSLPSSPFHTKHDLHPRRSAIAPPPYSLPPSPPSSANDPLLQAHSNHATTLLSQLRPYSPPESPPSSASQSAPMSIGAHAGPVPFLSPPPPYSPQHPHLVLDHDKLAPSPSLPPVTSDIFSLAPTAALTLLARSVELLLALPPQSEQRPLEHASLPPAIAKKFYSKSAPTIPLEPYLFRLHRFCPLSTAVYLTASFYLHKLVMVERLIELTPLTAHRLLLAALRVASKSIEDLQHAHARFAKVSGCSPEELRRLEVAFCYAMDFDLKVDCEMLEGQYMMLCGAVEGMATGRTSPNSSASP